ncbi:MAG: GntR family transcriptional regulator [Hyphomicrobiales bacterium]|nr:GntR family transcriptional regulator [Hyphomicrobiales bacterium]
MGERVSSKADHVYGELKEAILSGALEPGDPIDKLALCERLGVSRFPVSAAVSRLAFERLVVIEPQHGSFVSRISVEGVRERMFIRTALECEIAATAALRMPKDGRAALAANLALEREAVEAGDRQKFYELDVDFHQILTSHLGLRHSGEVLDGLRSHLERVRRLLMGSAGRLRVTFNDHQAVFSAIEAEAPDRARAAMADHLAGTTDQFETFARERPELFSA